MVLYTGDIIDKILSYHKTSEKYLRETALCLSSDYIELSPVYPYYDIGIRGVGISSYCPNYFDSNKKVKYIFYVDAFFFTHSVFDDNEYIWEVVLVSNELGLNELVCQEICDIYSLIDLSDVTLKSYSYPIFSLDGYESLMEYNLKSFIFEVDNFGDTAFAISLKHIVRKGHNDSVKEFSDSLKSWLSFQDSFINLNNLDLSKDKFSVVILLDLLDFSYHESAQYLKDFFLAFGPFLELINDRIEFLFEIEIYFSKSDSLSSSLSMINRPLHHPAFNFIEDYRKKDTCLIFYDFNFS